MLSALLADLSENAALSPVRISRRLRLPLTDLARLAGLHRNSLSQRPSAPSVQKSLEPIVRILAAAEELTGDADRAIIWFRHQPLAGHGGRTAMELVEQGQAASVFAHLEDLRDGAYA